MNLDPRTLPRLSDLAPASDPRHLKAAAADGQPDPLEAEWAAEDAARRAWQDAEEVGTGGVPGPSEWPDPVPFVRPAPGTGLPDGFGGTLLGDLAAMLRQRWGIPELLTVHTGLGVLCAATRGNGRIAIRSGAQFPVALYLLGLAPPGSMKSALLAALAAPLTERQAKAVAEHEPELRKARARAAALADAIRKVQDTYAKAAASGNSETTTNAEAELDGLIRQHLDAEAACVGVAVVASGADTTAERMADRAAANGGKVAVLSAEGALIENLAGHYSDGAARTEFVNAAYDGERFERERVGSGSTVLPCPWATLLQVVQPDLMTTMLGNAHMVRRGFLARFWPVEALEVPYLNRHDMPELDAGLMDRWAEAVAAVWDRSRVPFVLELGEARGPMRAFEHQRIRPAQDAAQSEHPLYAAWLSKAAMTSVRVAAVLQLAEDAGATGVGPGAGTAAAGYAAAVMGHAEHLFAGSKQAAATSPRGRVLGWLNYTANTANTANTPGGGPHTEGSGGYGRIGGGVSTRQAWRRFRDQAWCRRAEDARTVLADLAQLGWLDGPHKGTGPGRPTELWLLHPRLTEHYARMMAATR